MEDKKYEQEFAKRLLKYIEMFGLTQQEFADKMGVTAAAVSTWTLGQRTPRMSKVDEMCRFFGCTRNDLLGEINPDASDYTVEEKSIIELYRRASDQRKHIVYMILMMKEGD